MLRCGHIQALCYSTRRNCLPACAHNLRWSGGGVSDDDDIEVIDEDVVLMDDDKAPSSTKPAAASTAPETTTSAAAPKGGASEVTNKENDISGSAKEGVSKKRAIYVGGSGDEGTSKPEGGTGSSSPNGAASKRAKT